jgi:predicted nuclease with TOPRIM domain
MSVRFILTKWLLGDSATMHKKLKRTEEHMSIQREGLRRALEEYHSLRKRLNGLEDRLNKVEDRNQGTA